MAAQQPTLPTDREHDLPPFWDGRPVIWDEWQASGIVAFICPPPKSSGCVACGSQRRRYISRGRVARSSIVTHERIRHEDENRARLPLAWRGKRAPVALYELTAFRCPDCLHDQVQEMLDGTLWDLDDSDYDDAGSVNPTKKRGESWPG